MQNTPYNISSLQALKEFADTFSLTLTGGETIGLIGTLGAGKTTFTKNLINSVGGDGSQVTSPTFVLQHLYQTLRFNIEHWDLYRLEKLPPEINEIVPSSKIRLVEWSDKFDIELDIALSFTIVDNNKRIIEVQKFL